MMVAVVTTGTGGYDRLDHTHVPILALGSGEVLLKVRAAGVNNTEINTRLGWYSASVTDGTGDTREDANPADGGWGAATPFRFIQGTDCCGEVVAVGPGGDGRRVGERVLVRPCMRPHGFDRMDTVWMGTDFDRVFAQYVTVPEREAFAVTCGWSDAELAVVPCAYGTAETMIHRLATSGAIAGPMVGLNLRDLYLKDITLIGCTAWDEPVFPNLIGHIEQHAFRPVVAATYPLARIADAQRDFLAKRHTGKLVLLPP